MVRHADATAVSVSIAATDRLRIEITDDGIGLPAGGRRSGLANMADRAVQLGGEMVTEPGPDGKGTCVIWNVPLG